MALNCQLLALVVLISSFEICAVSSIPAFAGPYIAYGEQLQACKDWTPDKENFAFVNVTRFTRWNPYQPYKLQLITGTIVVHGLAIDDKFLVNIVMDLWNNNQWKRNALVLKFPGVCSAMRTHAPCFFQAFFDGDLESKGPCIVKTGLYSKENEPFNYTFPYFPILPYGQYRYRLDMFTPQNEKFACVQMIAHIVPKVAAT